MFQKKLYTYYLENYARAGQIGHDGKLEGGKKGGLFYDVQNLSRVWNHPYILSLAKTRADEKAMLEDNSRYELRKRKNGQVKVPNRPRRNCTGLSYTGPKLFNFFPEDIRKANTTNQFKTKLKTWIWEHIPSS